jgi:hypothetical protein
MLYTIPGTDMVCDTRVDDPHTTLEAVVKVTLSSATSKNLGLDNHVLALCRMLATRRHDCQLLEICVPMVFATASASFAL